jgi:hypothetical protein
VCTVWDQPQEQEALMPHSCTVTMTLGMASPPVEGP